MEITSDTPVKQSFEAIYEQYYDRVFKYIYTLVLNKADAEDITSETFISAYSNFDSYDESIASIGTWLTRIAHNKAVNMLRSAAYAKHSELPEEWDPVDEETDFTEEVENRDTVIRLYKRLSPEEREFLNFRYVMDLRDKEIASILGIQEKAVNKRYQRLLSKCRLILNS